MYITKTHFQLVFKSSRHCNCLENILFITNGNSVMLPCVFRSKCKGKDAIRWVENPQLRPTKNPQLIVWKSLKITIFPWTNQHSILVSSLFLNSSASWIYKFCKVRLKPLMSIFSGWLRKKQEMLKMPRNIMKRKYAFVFITLVKRKKESTFILKVPPVYFSK